MTVSKEQIDEARERLDEAINALQAVAAECFKVEPPKQKVIDLSCLVRSGVLCQFGDTKSALETPQYGTLEEYRDGASPFGITGGMGWWTCCRPAFGLWQVHNGGECPVPEGYAGEITRRSGSVIKKDSLVSANFTHDYGLLNRSNDIIAYKVTGLAEGWIHPWEVES